MKTLEEIKEILIKEKPFLKEKYKVKDVGIFGSYVRGDQQDKSDLDILVEFESPVGFFKFLEIEEYLEEITGIKVELVTKKALKPRIGEYILREVVNI
ncbi:MAG: nucleotidyltransferase family protein [Desulfobacterales bacterium]|jgi:predicted nucleotidyltransferase|nr:nucleotidyltransferase family protein [Desulfobacterales bacterium]